MFILLIASFMVSTGQVEPAMIPVLSEDISNMSNIGWFIIPINIVGTPYMEVHFSFWIEEIASNGSYSSSTTIVAPWVITAITPSTVPKQWNKGTCKRSLSFSV